jgi:hypothetical protein
MYKMSKLTEAFKNFNPRKAKDAQSLQEELKIIAETVFYEGYFLVNDKLKIFPIDIEFYMYDERVYKNDEYDWLKDYNMYHRNTTKEKVPYYPKKGSVYPHKSGVDVTFENGDQEYRASFLIRAYLTDQDNEVRDNPTYLNEEMFGENSFDGSGLNIKWKDEHSEKTGELEWHVRYNFHTKNKLQDMKPWRCIKPTVGYKPKISE